MRNTNYNNISRMARAAMQRSQADALRRRRLEEEKKKEEDRKKREEEERKKSE